MGFSVSFYSFSKKSNSTAVPSGTGTSYSCVLKSGSGILHPRITINMGLSTDPSIYNYAYIASYGRYYKIKEWTFEKGLWTAEMDVDVLATYKSTIGAASLYVLRASADKDGTIIDNLYPTKTGCSYDTSDVTRPWVTAGGGCYVLGMISNDPQFGSLNYYIVSGSGFATLVDKLLDTQTLEDNGFTLADCSLELQKSLIDPIQYIKSAVYIPIAFNNMPGTGVSGIDVYGWQQIPVGCNKLLNALPYITVSNQTITLKEHPDTTARGAYVNSAPYTKMQLCFPPFGVFDLDTSLTAGATSIMIECYLDVTSGKGILEVTCNSNNLVKVEAQVGVPIQLAQVSRDYLGAAMSLSSGIAGTIGSALTGNIAGAVQSATSGIGNSIQALMPRAQTMGGGGSFAQLFTNTRLEYQWFRPVDDDNSHNGRPLCQVKTPASLGGYMLIQDGDVAIDGTAAEADEIRMLLQSGFYYE